MAYCIMSETLGDDGFETSCVVHCHHGLTCPYDGRPASTVPLHGDTAHGSHTAILELWTERSGRQRPLHIHDGDMTDGSHDTASVTVCPCGPQIFEAA